jgi:hypothetical protein
MATTRTPARGPAGTPVTAVVPASLDHDELMAMLGQAGMLSAPSASNFHRMALVSGSLVTDQGTPQEESWPPTKRGPTMVVRIVKPPVYYNTFFMSADEKNKSVDARRIGRPELNGKFAKKYDDPAEQAADEYANLDAYEALAKFTGNRGSFKADVQLQIIPESGTLTGEEPVYTLSLSTTSALDWRGSTKNPSGGVVQDKNFIVQLAELAIEQATANGASKEELQNAVLNAMTALRLGGVVAEVYLVQTQSETDSSIRWTVVAFKPVHIELGEEQPALTAGESTETPVDDLDDLPF